MSDTVTTGIIDTVSFHCSPVFLAAAIDNEYEWDFICSENKIFVTYGFNSFSQYWTI